MSPQQSIADLLGPWRDPGWESSLIKRYQRAWNKPVEQLTNEELATLLRQRIAVADLLPSAQQRIADGFDDDTEMYEGELANAVAASPQLVCQRWQTRSISGR